MGLFLKNKQADSIEQKRQFVEVLYLETAKIVEKKARQYLYDPSESEDVLAEVFCAVMQYGDILQTLERSKQMAYLHVVTRNLCFKCNAKQAKENEHLSHGNEDYDPLDSATDHVSDVELTLSKQELKEELLQSMQLLSERDRLILINRYYMGFSDIESARLLGIDENNIRIYMTRARRRLKKHVTKRREEPNREKHRAVTGRTL